MHVWLNVPNKSFLSTRLIILAAMYSPSAGVFACKSATYLSSGNKLHQLVLIRHKDAKGANCTAREVFVSLLIDQAVPPAMSVLQEMICS